MYTTSSFEEMLQNTGIKNLDKAIIKKLYDIFNKESLDSYNNGFKAGQAERFEFYENL